MSRAELRAALRDSCAPARRTAARSTPRRSPSSSRTASTSPPTTWPRRSTSFPARSPTRAVTGPAPVGRGPGPDPRAPGCPAPRRRACAYLPRIAAAHLTIPQLFEAAVADVPGKPWLFFEDESYTYAEARERIAAAAAGLAERGVAQGDLVLATARNDPRYVFLWLAAAYLGAIHVAVDPRQTSTELEGLLGQVQPQAARDGRGAAGAVRSAGRAGRARPGRAGRRGGADPHLGHHRPLEARDPDPARVRDGGRGLSVVARADRGGPSDDLAAALPRERARLLRARLGGRAREPRAAAALLGERLPRLGPPLRRHRVQRDRRDGRDPDAPAGAAGRRRQPAAARLHRPGAAEGAPPGDRAALRARADLGLRDVGDHLRNGLDGAARAPTARSAGPASTPRSAR